MPACDNWGVKKSHLAVLGVPGSIRRVVQLSLMGAAVAVVVGCGGLAGPAGTAGRSGPGSGADAGRSSGSADDAGGDFASLRQRLLRDFRGTPVQIDTGQTDAAGFLRVAVPQPHGFEAGRVAVRPALAAVLDRLVEPLQQQPRWTIRIAGPVDAKGSGWIGPDRANAVRDYLVMKGVAASRFTAPQRTGASERTEITLIDLRGPAGRP